MKDDLLNYSAAAENNSRPILEKLAGLFAAPGEVLEVGSGAGQHALFFAKNLPHLIWQPADQGDYFDGLKVNLAKFGTKQIRSPIYFDLHNPCTFDVDFRYVYSANVLHIVASELVESFFEVVPATMQKSGLLCLYGPFKYQGKFTSESNQNFDRWLKQRDTKSGVKDFEWIEQLAKDAGLTLNNDIQMPSNNQLLCFQKF